MFVVNFDDVAGKRHSNRKETSCLLLLNAVFEPGVWDTKSPADWMPADKPTGISRIKLKKNWTRQPIPRISEHSAHLTPLSVDFRTWLMLVKKPPTFWSHDMKTISARHIMYIWVNTDWGNGLVPSGNLKQCCLVASEVLGLSLEGNSLVANLLFCIMSFRILLLRLLS